MFRTLTNDEILQKKSLNYDRLLKCINKHKFSPGKCYFHGRVYTKSYMGTKMLFSETVGTRSIWRYVPNPLNQKEYEDCKRDYERNFFHNFEEIKIPPECLDKKKNWNY